MIAADSNSQREDASAGQAAADAGALPAAAGLVAEQLRLLTAAMSDGERLQVYRAAARLLTRTDPATD